MDTSTESNDYPKKDKKCEYCNDDQKFTDDEFDKHLLIVHNEICSRLLTEKNKENLPDKVCYFI